VTLITNSLFSADRQSSFQKVFNQCLSGWALTGRYRRMESKWIHLWKKEKH